MFTRSPLWVISSHRVYRKRSPWNDCYTRQTSPSRAASFGRNVNTSGEKFWPVFLSLGLPITLFLAWAFELTPEVLKLDETVDRAKFATSG